jgi:LmbE family N-acetylglucosaminyl deacetylase
MVILAIGPHPDDVEFSCFGTLARLSKKEEVEIAVLTDGKNSGNPSQRKKEAMLSAKLIGAKVRFLEHPDGNLLHDPENVGEVRALIKELRPSTIFAPYPVDRHQDHSATSRIVTSSLQHIPRLIFYETPSTMDFNPNLYFDITDTFDLKLKAIRAHRSQHDKAYFDEEQIRAIHVFRAWQIGKAGRLYEAFSLRLEVQE